MRRLRALLWLGGWLLSLGAGATPQPLSQMDVLPLQAGFQGKGHLLVLWSVDCLPCLKELALIGTLGAEKSGLPITLISTDEEVAPEDVAAVLARYGVSQYDAWQFADTVPARLRYAIDPAWRGELPRSYFYPVVGERVTHSGLLSEAMMRRWLALPVSQPDQP